MAGVPVEPATLPDTTVGPVLVTPASPSTPKGAAVPISMLSARTMTAASGRASARDKTEIARNFICSFHTSRAPWQDSPFDTLQDPLSSSRNEGEVEIGLYEGPAL